MRKPWFHWHDTIFRTTINGYAPHGKRLHSGPISFHVYECSSREIAVKLKSINCGINTLCFIHEIKRGVWPFRTSAWVFGYITGDLRDAV